MLAHQTRRHPRLENRSTKCLKCGTQAQTLSDLDQQYSMLILGFADDGKRHFEPALVAVAESERLWDNLKEDPRCSRSDIDSRVRT